MEEMIKPDKKLFTKTVWVLLTVSAFILAGVSIVHTIIYIADGDPNAPKVIWLIAVLAILVMWLMVYPIAILWIRNLSYMIQDDRITIHKGILTKTHQNIPYRSVTDFILQRSLYDRFLGIGSIRIQTAGQSQSATGYEGNMAGLVEYEKLHNQLREKIRLLHPISESLTTNEPVEKSMGQILEQMLHELKAIRKNTEK
ncbi:MAG TPA: PH domain-containing protein [Sedimentisphaerales bacterium]|nr:PH domain-containing protein [Sedimentisphaerales bacterium]